MCHLTKSRHTLTAARDSPRAGPGSAAVHLMSKPYEILKEIKTVNNTGRQLYSSERCLIRRNIIQGSG